MKTMQRRTADHTDKAGGLLLSGVFLVAFSLLAFEVALTRILSALLSYHFVFAVISLALMGQGLGALYHAIQSKGSNGTPTFFCSRLALTAAGCAFCMGISTALLMVLGHVTPMVPIYLVVIFPPFFMGGIFFAQVFRRFAHQSARIYAADLAGAGGGCVGIVMVLQLLSAPQALYATALIAVIGSTLLALSSPGPRIRILRISIGLGLVLLLMLVASVGMDKLKSIPVGANPNKEIADALAHGHIEKSTWSAFGQTDLVSYPDFPLRKDMYIDGTAGTPMYRFDGTLDAPGQAVMELLNEFPGYLPLKHLDREKTDNCLIIGPGGGRDVLLALAAGFRHIEAVEVNPDFVDLVKAYSEYNGGIFTRLDTVQVHVGEGRSYLRRQGGTYDTIFMSLPVTNTSRSREGIALTENFLLTVEAIEGYLDHMTPEGNLVVVTHGDVEALRLLSVMLSALKRKGVMTQAAMERIILIGHSEYPVLVLCNTPVLGRRALDIFRSIVRNAGRTDYHYQLRSSYIPNLQSPKVLNPVLTGLAQGTRTLAQLIDWAAKRGHDITPVNDNRPFFFNFESTLPPSIVWILATGSVLLGLTGAAMILKRASLLFKEKDQRNEQSAAGMSLSKRIGDGDEKTGRDDGGKLHFQNENGIKISGKQMVCFFSLFAGLGAGFMMIEISLAQHCFLFIGRPVLSISTVLFSLLFGAGLSGIASQGRSLNRPYGTLKGHLLLIAAVLLLLLVSLPTLFNLLLGYSLSLRLMIVILLLTGVGFAMGFPFPLGLRILTRESLEHWIPWMLGVNGISSVLGSAICVALSITLGANQAMAIGGGIYFSIVCILKWGETDFKL